MKKIRIGHIGTKHDHSQDKLDCVRKFPDLFEVVGIVEDDPHQREKIKNNLTYCDYRFMTEDQLFNEGCDCAMIESFEYDLPYYAKRCVDNGIAVHIDKPAGRDLQTFEETLRIAKARKLPVQLAYMYRYNPAVLDCMQLIKAGNLGEIYSVSAIMNTGHPTTKREWLGGFDAGIMFFLGCHMIDLIYAILGTPEKITTHLKSSGINGTTSIDLATAVFDYKRGTSIVQANSCEINGYGRRQLVVCGSKGTYEINPLERPIGTKYTESSFAATFDDKHIERDIETVPTENRYDEMMLDFAAMVRCEKENPCSYEYELQLQKIILATCGYIVDFKTTTVL